MGVALDLDDALWLSNQDKVRLRTFVDSSLLVIAKAQMPPCHWYQFICKHDQKKALSPLQP
jgi:hypothetical protein